MKECYSQYLNIVVRREQLERCGAGGARAVLLFPPAFTAALVTGHCEIQI